MHGPRDPTWRLAFAAAGAVVGLRAAQVIRAFSEAGSYSSIAGGGTFVGLVVAVAALAVVGRVWDVRRPGSPAPARLWAACAGMIGGYLVGNLLGL